MERASIAIGIVALLAFVVDAIFGKTAANWFAGIGLIWVVSQLFWTPPNMNSLPETMKNHDDDRI